MIRRITENIKAELIQSGMSSEQVQYIGQIISLELGKYEVTEKPTAVSIRDNSDIEIISRYFLAKATAGLSPRSLKYYKFVINRFFNVVRKHIKEVTADDIRYYLTKLRLGGVKLTSIDNERRALSSLFTWASNEDMIGKNPCVRVEKVRTPKIVRKPLSEEEMELLRMKASSDRNRAIIEFLYSTGCRVSEVVSINRGDIDFDSREVVVLGKGNKYRKVFLSPRCIMTLKKYLESRKDDNPALFVSDFDGLNGGFARYRESIGIARLGVSGVENMIRKTGKKAGIQGVHPHRIRRTAATLALRRGMPIEQVSKMLGHESLDTTTIYAITSIDDVKNSHEKYLI